MKKVLFFLASALMLASCENFYIDKNLGGSDFTPTDVRNIDYTLTDADYKAIMEELVRLGKLDKTYIATDFFDASINRIAAWTIGLRNTRKAILNREKHLVK